MVYDDVAMDPMELAALAVGTGVGVALALTALKQIRTSRRHALVDERAQRLGHTEPVSLHPRINYDYIHIKSTILIIKITDE